MNRSFLHLLLICCLLIALPMQGLAKVGIDGMGTCHDGSAVAMGQAGEGVDHADDANDAAADEHAAAHHDLQSDELAHDGHAHQHEPDSSSQQHHSPSGKTGHCAPCCIGAALLGHALLIPAKADNSPVLAWPGTIPVSIWLPGPERPPRTTSLI